MNSVVDDCLPEMRASMFQKGCCRYVRKIQEKPMRLIVKLISTAIFPSSKSMVSSCSLHWEGPCLWSPIMWMRLSVRALQPIGILTNSFFAVVQA